MSEEVTAGGREFVFAMIWAALLYAVCGVIMSVFSRYFVIGAIISLLIFCVFGFFVLTRYTARFTYTLKDGRLRINRMIGKRNKEIEIPCSAITDTSYGSMPRSFPKRRYNMTKSIISSKRLMYIVYTDADGTLGAAIIQPSSELMQEIEKERKKPI